MPVASSLVVAAVLLTGCVSSPVVTPTPTVEGSNASAFGPLGAAGCEPASPVITSQSSPEIQGTGLEPDTSLYALVIAENGASFPVGEELKFVTRITGEGDLSAELVDPSGEARQLDWGPEPHERSNYHRPGDEWGLGFTVNRVGCWELRLSTATSGGSFWLSVG